MDSKHKWVSPTFRPQPLTLRQVLEAFAVIVGTGVLAGMIAFIYFYVRDLHIPQ